MSIENYKKDIIRELEYYWKMKDKANEDFEVWNDKSKYSGSFIQERRAEADTDINDYKLGFYKAVRDLRDKYISELKPNTKVIETLEYQARLSNVIKLAEFSEGSLSMDSLNFMIEANDTDSLKVLANKYKKSTTLSEAFNKSDLDQVREEYKALCQAAENHIGYEMLGASRSSILSSFR